MSPCCSRHCTHYLWSRQVPISLRRWDSRKKLPMLRCKAQIQEDECQGVYKAYKGARWSFRV